MDTNQPSPAVEALLANPAVSNWLKDALRGAVRRDPVDAAGDAELLAQVMTARMNEILLSHLARPRLARTTFPSDGTAPAAATEVLSPEARFDRAILRMPAAYKALLAAVAFEALNDTKTLPRVAAALSVPRPELLAEAAGVFLDLKACFDRTPWLADLPANVDVRRRLGNAGDWVPAFFDPAEGHPH